MRLAENRLQAYVGSLSSPPKIILLFGSNDPLLTFRTDLFLPLLTEGTESPSTDILEAKELPEILNNSVHQPSLFSTTTPRRISIVTKITDTTKKYFETMIEAPNHFFILNSLNLRTQSALVKLCNTHDAALAVPCYEFTEGDKGILLSLLSQRYNISLTEPQRTALLRHCVENALDYRNTIEKSFLHLLNPESKTDSLNKLLDDELTTTHDTFDLIIALSQNHKDKIHSIYTSLRESGVEDILILRALTTHYNKVSLIKSALAENNNSDFSSALRQTKLVLFFKHRTFFETEVRQWNMSALFEVQKRFAEIETLYKTTPSSFKARFGRTLLQVASLSRSKTA